MATKYSYTISTGTANGKVDSSRLKQEIQESSITISLNSGADGQIETSGDVLGIWFSISISAGEKTTLDEIVSSHDGEPLSDNTLLDVVIQEESISTGGHWQACTIKVNMNSTDVWHSQTHSWPFPVNLLSASYKTDANAEGDVIAFTIGEDTVIGAIGANVAVSDTIITVGQTVIDNAFIGAFVKLSDGINTDNLGRITSIGASTITVETGAANAFLAATPTYVKMSVKMVNDIELDSDDRVSFGESKIGGSYIPAGIEITAKYKNASTTARDFKVKLEYLY